MPNTLTIQPGTPADFPALVELENLLFDDSDGRLGRRHFYYHLRRQNLLLVAHHQHNHSSQIAGYLLLLIREHTARLYSLAVSPHFQKQGIARALVQQAISHAKQLGKQEMVLEVKVGNAAAIALYKSLGFVERKIIQGYYYDGTDAVRMSLALIGS